MATIEFFWDAVSPYTYLASTRIDAVAQRTGAKLVWRPFFLGGVFDLVGNTGNKTNLGNPAKLRFMMSDLKLWARHYDVPLTPPQPFPTNSLLAGRVALVVPPEKLPEYSRRVIRAYWGEGRDIAQPEEVQRVVSGMGLDGPALIERARDPAIKHQLHVDTEEAVQRGAFGAPTFFIDNEIFWGNDRLMILEEFLKGRLSA
jgi:2-hydroxychromene-2-carboxylate isomerase